MRLDLGAASFVDARLPASGSRLVNCYAVPRAAEEGQEGAYYVQGSAGLELVANMGASPCDGLFNYADQLFGVFGTSIVKDITGSPTVVGSIGGSGLCQFGNDRAGLVIYRSGLLTLTNKTTNVTTSFTLPGGDIPSTVAELDNYTVYGVAGSDKMYASAPVDPTSIDPLSFTTAEARPDIVKRILSNKLTMYMLGTESTELFYNAGVGTGFPFLRYSNAMWEIGIGPTDSGLAFNNKCLFIGHTKRVYMGEDTTINPVSPPWVEALLSSLTPADFMGISAFGYNSEGRDFYSFTIPSGGTYELCIQTGMWHNRVSKVAGSLKNRWLGRTGAYLAGGFYVGSALDGKVYRLVTDRGREGADKIRRTIVTPPFGPKQTRTPLHYVDVDYNPGSASTDDTFELSYSDDDGRSFGNPRILNFPIIGKRRAIARALGIMRRRQLKIEYEGDAPFRIENMYIGMGTGWPKAKYQPGQGGDQYKSGA